MTSLLMKQNLYAWDTAGTLLDRNIVLSSTSEDHRTFHTAPEQQTKGLGLPRLWLTQRLGRCGHEFPPAAVAVAGDGKSFRSRS